jgi:hypothetical protein
MTSITRHLLNGLILLCLGMVSGCILPIPNRSVDGWAVESQVVDPQTHAPVPHAQVFDASDPSRKTQSDASGHFRLGRVYQWHAAYLWSPISYPILPFTGDLHAPIRGFRVVAAGYDEQQFVAVPEQPPLPQSQPTTSPSRKTGLLKYIEGSDPSLVVLPSATAEDFTLFVPVVPLHKSEKHKR